METKKRKFELIVHPHELTDRWVELAKKLKLDRLSIHPVGGMNAHETLQKLMETVKDEEFRKQVDKLNEAGIEVGYEFHALSYLLPRELFKTNPEYFRINIKEERTAWGNFCFSNPEARSIICKNAVKLAKELYGSCHEYYFWLDDAKRLSCYCDECKKHSFAYHQLKLMNEIVRELRREIPDAKVCYLAYYDGVAIPEDITPEEGVFVEYAPFERYLEPDTFAFDGEYLELVKKIIDFFGKTDSKVLEYWYDNSIYYRRAGNKLVELIPDNSSIAKDFDFYKELGFERLSSFACNLCDEYVKMFGDPDFSAVENRKV